MKKVSNLYEKITFSSIERAAHHAFKGHSFKQEVIDFRKNLKENVEFLYQQFLSGEYKKLLKYKDLERINNDGKLRKIKSPFLETRIYQHLVLDLINPIYKKKDNGNAVNCKKGYGLNSKIKRKSLLWKCKSVFYDRLDLNYWFIIDQRKCYEHVKRKTARKQLKKFVDDKQFIDFAMDVCFVDDKLPIGTPTSPLIHHIVMLSFDIFIKEAAPYSVRYADDNLIFTRDKDEAHALIWRIKNYWWYELGIRAKRSTGTIHPITHKCNYCGFIFCTNRKTKCDHNKGFVVMRKSIVRRMKRANNSNWPSYYGFTKNTDQYSLLRKIEKKLRLRELTSRIKINRKMDAENISLKDLVGIKFSIYDYEIRFDSNNSPNWIKCLIGIEEVINNKKTGKILAREFHGNYQGLIQFIFLCEKELGKDKILPIEGAEIENRCGYVFRNSTNFIKYIQDEKY